MAPAAAPASRSCGGAQRSQRGSANSLGVAWRRAAAAGGAAWRKAAWPQPRGGPSMAGGVETGGEAARLAKKRRAGMAAPAARRINIYQSSAIIAGRS